MVNQVKPENKENYEYYHSFEGEKTSYSNYKVRLKRGLSKEKSIIKKFISLKKLTKQEYIKPLPIIIKKHKEYTLIDLEKFDFKEFISFEPNLNNLKIKGYFTKKDIIDFYIGFYPENKDILGKIDNLVG